MKILMLTPYLPYPPTSGGHVRSYNLIKNLSKNNDIYLVSLIKNEEEKKYQKKLLEFCKEIYLCKRSTSPWTFNNIFRSIFGKYPFLVVRNYSKEAERTVKLLLKKSSFDLIHAETFYIMPHIPKTEIPILLVEQTIEYRVYEHFVRKLPILFRPLFYFDIFKLKMWETIFWKKANLVGAVSEDDEKKMKELVPEMPIAVIPNAAGEDLYNLYKETKTYKEPIFLYQGNFSWLQNVEAAQILIKSIFPLIKKSIPAASCVIGGQGATDKITSYNDAISVVNIQPSDIAKVADLYESSSIFIAPIEGPGGTRLKILGAMASGLPVISSPTGVSGLDVEDNKHVLIARSPEEFAQQALRLLKDKKLYDDIRHNARKLIEEKYSWPGVSKNLENIYYRLTH